MPTERIENIQAGDRVVLDSGTFMVMEDPSTEGMIPGIVSLMLWPVNGGTVFTTEYAHREQVTVWPRITWKAGDLAYYVGGKPHTGGLIPCKVLGKRTHNWVEGPETYVVVKMTANRGWYGFNLNNKPAYDYMRGDLYQDQLRNGFNASRLVSRSSRYVSGGVERWIGHGHDFSALPDLTESLDKHTIRNW